MRKNLILLFEVALALAALVAGYIFVVGWTAVNTPVAARTLTVPDQPHILYLAPAGTERGQVKDEVMQNRGATRKDETA